jgi:hypothetical protein
MAIVSENWYRYMEVVGGEGQYAEYVSTNQVRMKPGIPKDIRKFAGMVGMWPPAGCYKGDTTVKGYAWILVRGSLP